MMGQLFALLKREVWEHRSIYVTPTAIASIVTLGTLAMLMFAGGFAKELDIAIFGATNIAGDAERKIALTGFFIGTSWLFLFAAMVLTVFYTLDSLYAERKDKSILFWRSLPITDAEAVVSKLLTALIVIPLFTTGAIIVTHLVNLLVTSVWVSIKGGDAGHLIWGSVPLLDNWLAGTIVILATAVWMSPFIGWFLFVSAFTKRSPLLMAFMPLVLIPLIEIIFLRSSLFAQAVFGRGGMIPLFRGMDVDTFFDKEKLRISEEVVGLLPYIDLSQFLTSLPMWSGVVVCGLFVTAAIYVRRYRDES
ncbi:MAG: ABC-2 transporter permease [Gammaproteobacteria bacterium]|nr:ABC-2 transporter permease [Gammaproteobacteria bacterium]